MPQTINQNILRAITEAVDDSGMSLSCWGKNFGLQASALSRWLNGTSTSISRRGWEKLYPAIKEYLPVEYRQAPPTTPRGLEEKIDDLLREAVAGLTPKQKLAVLEAVAEICRQK